MDRYKFTYKTVSGFKSKIYTLDQLIETPLRELSDLHGLCELVARKRFTEHSDRRDVELFEGDIVDYRGTNKKITFECGKWCISTINKDTCAGSEINKKYSLYLDHSFTLKVGSIYENPELLN